MFKTEIAEKRIRELVLEIGTDFLMNEGVYKAAISDKFFDLKLERTVLINATSVHIGKILMAANASSEDEKRKAVLKAKDKLINDAAFSDEGAFFVVAVISAGLGWQKIRNVQATPVHHEPPQQYYRPSPVYQVPQQPVYQVPQQPIYRPPQQPIYHPPQQPVYRPQQQPVHQAPPRQIYTPSLALGILSIILDSFFLTSIVGLILGIIGVAEAEKNKDNYKTNVGFGLSLFGLICGVIITVILIFLLTNTSQN
jgi:hypothetical protein